jgi:RNA polymerase sigma-70 factor (ECF subfamily)
VGESVAESIQDARYREAAAEFGAALSRLACAYEADADRRCDLVQEIHLALWRSFAGFDCRCSLRTWVYRVAHNTAATYMIRRRRSGDHRLVSLDEVEDRSGQPPAASQPDREEVLAQLLKLIQALAALDRQVILSYLEGMDAAAIGEITGLSAGNVATKIHRIKRILAQQFQQGGSYGK